MHLISVALSHIVEGLSQELRKCKVGLQAGQSLINHLLFADDLALCAGSPQKLLNIVETAVSGGLCLM